MIPPLWTAIPITSVWFRTLINLEKDRARSVNEDHNDFIL